MSEAQPNNEFLTAETIDLAKSFLKREKERIQKDLDWDEKTVEDTLIGVNDEVELQKYPGQANIRITYSERAKTAEKLLEGLPGIDEMIGRNVYLTQLFASLEIGAREQEKGSYGERVKVDLPSTSKNSG